MRMRWARIKVIKSRRMEWVGHIARIGEMRNEYKILVRKPKGIRPLGRNRRRWKGNIRMYLRDIGWEVVDWIHPNSGQGPVVGSYEHGNETSGSKEGG
jgi:hypothetical protein